MHTVKRLGFAFDFLLVLLGGLFLIDPNVRFLDRLPDAVGYLLIFFGLSRISDLCEKLSEARRAFGILLGIGLIQILLELLVHRLLGGIAGDMNAYEIPTAILVCSFCLALAKIFLLIPAFRQMFSGLAFLAEKTGGVAILTERRGRTKAMVAQRFTSLFIVVSSVLSVLPELTVLTSVGSGNQSSPGLNNGGVSSSVPFEKWFEMTQDTSESVMNWFPYADLFRVVCVAIVIVFAFLWLLSYLRFFRALLKDRAWLEALRLRYEEEILPQTGMLSVRRFHRAFLCFFIGVIFTAGLRFSHYPVLPDFVFAAFVLLGLLLLGDMAKGRRLCVALSLPLLAVSVTHFILNLLYLKHHVPKDSLHQTEPYYDFLRIRFFGAIEAILTVLLVLALLRAIYLTFKNHTGARYEGQTPLYNDSTKKLHKGFFKRTLFLGAVFSVAGIGCLLDACIGLTLPWLWLVTAAVSLIAIWNFLYFLQDLKEQIENYFDSDGMNKKRL